MADFIPQIEENTDILEVLEEICKPLTIFKQVSQERIKAKALKLENKKAKIQKSIAQDETSIHKICSKSKRIRKRPNLPVNREANQWDYFFKRTVYRSHNRYFKEKFKTFL